MVIQKWQLPSFVVPVCFGISIVVFVILKWPHVSLPFFWDENGVYGRMAFDLADRSLTLHPKAIDQWVSRGHPLIYPNYIAVFLKLFGINTTVAHAANLLLTLGFLITLFYQLSRRFAPAVGLMACVLLMMQPLFFTQSVFVLPEIPLAFMLWLTAWGFVYKNRLLYVLAATAALFIKESAIIWIVSLILWHLYDERRIFSKNNLLLLLPFLPFLIFLQVQKNTFGWYMFPYHIGGFDLHWPGFSSKIIRYTKYIFWEEGRFMLSFILIWGITFLFIQQKPDPAASSRSLHKRWQAVGLALTCYFLFSTITFFTKRYAMVFFPYLCAGVAWLLHNNESRKNAVYPLLLVFLLLFITKPFKKLDGFNYDNDMYYVQSIASSKKTIQYMLDHQMMNQGEFSATFPIVSVTNDPRFGYLPKDTIPRYSIMIQQGVKYAVQIIPGSQLDNPEHFPLDTLDQWHDGNIHTIIYQVMSKDSLNAIEQKNQ